MSTINSYMMNGKGNSMDKVRRVERMVAMTKLLVDSPQKLIPLNYFCDFFGMAKSTVSEDLTCVRQSMEHFQLGTLETVAGVAGGVRFIPHRKGTQANDILRDVQARLMEPDRIIPGGFIYMSDILYDWHVMTRLGEIIMTRFMDRNPDYILTVETKGIPLAVMVARAFNKPLVIARRDSKVTEGSAISINYVTGSSGRIQTMTLTKRAIPPNARVLIIDDFMKAGGTAKGLKELVLEMSGIVVGTGVLVATAEPNPKLIDDYESLFTFYGIDENTKKIILDEYNADITLLTALTSENQLNTLTYMMERLLTEQNSDRADLMEVIYKLFEDMYLNQIGEPSTSFNFKMESWFEAVRPIDVFCCVSRMRGLSFMNEK